MRWIVNYHLFSGHHETVSLIKRKTSMKSSSLQKFRAKLAANEPVVGLWITLESASITEMAVASGLDWVLIDAEHGHLDWKEIMEHMRATVRSDTIALVRITEVNAGLIKRALDVGADGVVVPWIESVEQLEQAVKFANYPLRGLRGIGAERATAWGKCFAEHAAEANDNVLVIPIIESVKGAENIEALCKVDGVDLIFFGPADYSASAGFAGQWEGPGVAETILSMKDTARRLGKRCGIVTTDNANLRQRIDQGFQMLAFGTDSTMIFRSLDASLASLGKPTTLRPDLSVVDSTVRPARLRRPPESMRPDRGETMNPVGSGLQIELAPGVHLECLVGAQNQARGLTTGFVTFDPLSVLPYHTHPCSESITLISGHAAVLVEGRQYTLSPFDNITIPRGLAHSTVSLSSTKPALLHVALASDTPTRDMVDHPFPVVAMPDRSEGCPPFERVTRFQSAHRFEAGPNTEFIDYFNQTLMPGIEMSGGYGLFQCGGRLPAHIHDFDESICIVTGVATCVVEGRHYSMSNGSTALQPRGRVHYFINESSEAMAMIWVYAGPMPERIMVDEHCATVAGDPWKTVN